MTVAKLTNAASRMMLLSLVGTTYLSVGCTGQGFYGAGKKIDAPAPPIPAKPTKVPEAAEARPPVVPNNQEQTTASASLPTAVPTQTPTSIPIVIPTQAPIILPQIVPTVAPIAPSQSAAGQMEFVIQAFANMEHGFHALDIGYRAVLEDAQGVVATAKLNVDACVNSQQVDQPGQGYTRVKLSPDAQFIREGASGGSAKLSICLDNNVDNPTAAANCQDVSGASLAGGDAERATQYSGDVNYQVSGRNVQVDTKSIGMSAWHPVYGFACPGRSFNDYQSPIVLDLDNNGRPDLIDVWKDQKKVYFDLRAEGKKVRTGWVDRKDGFLVYEEASTGKIIDGSVLLGEYSVKKGDSQSKGRQNFGNGFEALAQYDDNKDGRMDAKDSIFAKLRIWRDENSSGTVDQGELLTLKKLGIVSISLAFENAGTESSPYIVADNHVKLKGSFRMADGSDRKLFDIWFKQRRFSDAAVTSNIK